VGPSHQRCGRGGRDRDGRLGAAAIFGGTFGQDNVRDRLEPQAITFPPAAAMTPEEKAEVGDFAGASVDTGIEAEAYSRYIGLHVTEIGAARRGSGTGPLCASGPHLPR
jgi:hypothetical protein